MDLRIYPIDHEAPVGGCRLGKVAVSSAPRDATARTGGRTVRVEGAAYIVVQKGRSFQRTNPKARVLADGGRYLVIDWAEPEPWIEEPCFAVIPYADGAVDFGLRRSAPAVRLDRVAQLADRIAAADLKAKVEALAAIHTRESDGPGFRQALDLCQGWLRAAGCTVSRQRFATPGCESFNLVGTRKGRAAQPKLFVVGGHLDSVNHEDGHGARAPGADDNASGAVTVVALAQALAGVDLAHDVRFVLFGGEEQGLFGSKHFVSRLRPADRRRLGGMLNIDMAASRNTVNPTVLLEGHRLSQAMIDALGTAAATYTTPRDPGIAQPLRQRPRALHRAGPARRADHRRLGRRLRPRAHGPRRGRQPRLRAPPPDRPHGPGLAGRGGGATHRVSLARFSSDKMLSPISSSFLDSSAWASARPWL